MAKNETFAMGSFEGGEFVWRCPGCRAQMIMEEIHDCTVKGGEDMARHGTLKKEQIVGLRRELGLSMRAFADVIGINASTVSRYETDGMGPSRDVESKIKALAGGWDIDLDSFLV